MAYPFPSIETLLAQAAADITGSDLPGADGFLPQALLPYLGAIQAGFAFGHYDAIAYAMQQATPFTATDEYLDAWAALKGVFRKDATAAGGNGKSFAAFTGTPASAANPGAFLPQGTLINRLDGFQYSVLAEGQCDASGNVVVPVVATTTGALGNSPAGVQLTLGTGITGINSGGRSSGAITGGADQEVDADLRSRMLFAYANPPAGGDQTDYVTWALAVPGVTRAWCVPNGLGPGTVTIQFMMDNAEAATGGFPQGTNGVAAGESRASAATGDQLAVADAIYPLRPVTALVYAVAPINDPINYAITELAPNTAAIQAGIVTALQGMHLRKASPGGTLYPSDWNEAVASVPGIVHFAITSPSTAHTSQPGALATVGTPTYAAT